MPHFISTLMLSAVLLSLVGAESRAQTNSPQNVTYRIDFLGRDPTDDWVLVASKLLDGGLAPIGNLAITKPGAGLCESIMEVLNFPKVGLKCSAKMDALLKKMNPSLVKVVPIGSTAQYPDLPLETFTWTLFFDTSNAADSSRHRSIASVWGKFQIEDKSRGGGPQVNTVLKGFRTRVTAPPTSEATEFMRSLRRYNDALKRIRRARYSH